MPTPEFVTLLLALAAMGVALGYQTWRTKEDIMDEMAALKAEVEQDDVKLDTIVAGVSTIGTDLTAAKKAQADLQAQLDILKATAPPDVSTAAQAALDELAGSVHKASGKIDLVTAALQSAQPPA